MIDSRYISRAQAIGAAAAVNRIDTTTGLDHQAPAAAHSSLPPNGGRAEAMVENYSHSVDKPRFLKILGLRHAKSRVESKGDGNGGNVSHSYTIVHDYALLDQLTAAEIETQLQTEHPGNSPEAMIRPVGNRLVGLKLDGHEVHVELDEKLFQEAGTKDLLRKRFEGDSELRNKQAWRFSADAGAITIPEYKGYYVCSLVKSVEWGGKPHPDVTIDGYTLRWKGFGRIYLGELLVGEGTRSLTMIRAKMGSPVDGSGSGGSVDQQGATMP